MSLGACTHSPPSNEVPIEVEERVVIDGQVQPYPAETLIRTEALDGTPSMSQTVLNLVQQAITAKQANNYDQAAAALERAIRFEARNPTVWYELADVRFMQKQYHQATQFARKSLALSGRDDTELKRRNWYLLSRAYEVMGESDNAAQYRQKLELNE